MNSKPPARYIKTRLSDNLKNTILVHAGIFSEKDVRRKSAILECGRCQTVNSEVKYCISCSYPLVPSAYEEMKADEDLRLRELERKYDKDFKLIREEKDKQISSLKEEMTALRQAHTEIMHFLKDPPGLLKVLQEG